MSNELYDLAEQAYFNRGNNSPFSIIQQWLEAHEGNQGLLKEAANYKNNENNQTPLHLLALASSPMSLLETLMKLAPEALQVQDYHGCLPLHYACRRNNNPSIVRIILDAYPKAAEAQSIFGYLPLHWACKCGALPEVVWMLLEAYPKAAEVSSTIGKLPLHYACARGAHPDVIRKLVEAYPMGARVQDNDGLLPIYCASLNSKVSPDVVRLLLVQYPEGVKVPTSSRRLPLHMACNLFASLDVLQLLLEAYPESVDIKDSSGNAPSHYLRQGRQFRDDADQKFLLHNAVISGLSVHLVKLLLEAFPEMSRTRDNYGKIPLHYACSKPKEEILIDAVVLLVEADPTSFFIADDLGEIPFKLWKEAASQVDDKGMLLLHYKAAHSNGFPEKSLHFLMEANPDGITIPDNDNLLPFHHACLNRDLLLEELMRILMLYPESILCNN
jgi:ankyrin repeat protein